MLSTNENQKLNVIIRKKEPKANLATFLHGACWSPVKSTFLKAIEKNHFTTWPGLTTKLITRHLLPNLATTLGHQRHDKHSLQSTKLKVIDKTPIHQDVNTTLTQDIDQDAFPQSDIHNKKTNEVICSVIQTNTTDLGFTDLTGRFPYRSSRGNEYILVAYNYDGNCILAEAIKNREAKSITSAWTSMNTKFAVAGIQPKVYLLDNEISKEFKAALHKANVTFQLVPPHCHRANLAERAIQTFKAHFKAGLASVDPDFPLTEWDRLLPHAVLTLNLHLLNPP